jgi:hypothetical protein
MLLMRLSNLRFFQRAKLLLTSSAQIAAAICSNGSNSHGSRCASMPHSSQRIIKRAHQIRPRRYRNLLEFLVLNPYVITNRTESHAHVQTLDCPRRAFALMIAARRVTSHSHRGGIGQAAQ